MEGTLYMEDEQISNTNPEVLGSDEEEEKYDFEENQFSLEFELDETKIPSGAKVVVYSGKCAQALIRIITDDSLTQIGKVTAKKGKDPKEGKECLKIFTAHNLVIMQDDGVSGSYCG